jgi:hypothetical protein
LVGRVIAADARPFTSAEKERLQSPLPARSDGQNRKPLCASAKAALSILRGLQAFPAGVGSHRKAAIRTRASADKRRNGERHPAVRVSSEARGRIKGEGRRQAAVWLPSDGRDPGDAGDGQQHISKTQQIARARRGAKPVIVCVGRRRVSEHGEGVGCHWHGPVF